MPVMTDGARLETLAAVDERCSIYGESGAVAARRRVLGAWDGRSGVQSPGTLLGGRCRPPGPGGWHGWYFVPTSISRIAVALFTLAPAAGLMS